MKRLLITLAIGLISLSPTLLVAVPAYADSKTEVCNGIGEAGTSCSTNNGGVSNLIGSVVKILSDAVGVAAIIMLIIAGLQYVTAGGDSNAVGAAKNTVIYALIGLIIAALAQVLVHFVIENVKT